MTTNPDESDDGVPGSSESTLGDSDDDDGNTVDTGDYLSDDGGTGGYGSISDDDSLDPGNPESGIPDGDDSTNDVVSPDLNENSDDDEIMVNPDRSVSIDENRLGGGYRNVENVVDEVRNIISGGSNETSQVGGTTVLEEQLRNLRGSLTGMDGSIGDSSSGELLMAGAADVAVVVTIGAVVFARGDDK